MRYNHEGCRSLLSNILLCAVQDYRQKRLNSGRKELLAFFRSPWFVYICDQLDLDPASVLEELGLRNSVKLYESDRHETV